MPKSNQLNEDIVELIPALRAFARSFYRDAADADDLVQETLIRALSKIHQFRPGTNMKSWLFTIMRNTFCTRHMMERREAPGSAACISEGSAIDPTQEWSLRGRELIEAVERLPDKQREVLVLVGALGVAYNEAATICGCSIGTIKSRLNRARQRLLVEIGETTSTACVEQAMQHPVGLVAWYRTQ
ncbi:RNA polymerase, sigma-24 subunit, RpoE [Candidatus Filomicrobium marinum]|uniref:RNA polymerase sigma factor n=1 Tax=Candidatus Filomicrobium marinum TaxID=1608628 RepID=A0A0D6JBW5_9HYPH|nr:sigma-70 family RNA polymerase sigma factor [Candidatus Filomicrobium marinum]CFX04560.1 RNA polymerase, sigma-24 subunit, RpoE [Candidatus Filomicrobium marinum]CPR16083.1 RNA polymerase, sigma-24 subunit, RpoE [Candidatus Filomicrobium marinum]